MSAFINDELLKNDSDLSAKFKSTVYLSKGCYRKIESVMSLAGCRSRNDALQKAVDFYFGFLSSQYSQEYLCSVLGSQMKGIVNSLGSRVSRSNFRLSVELDMANRMLAQVVHINGAAYEKLRLKSIAEVKRVNGAIDILSAVEQDGTLPQEDEY